MMPATMAMLRRLRNTLPKRAAVWRGLRRRLEPAAVAVGYDLLFERRQVALYELGISVKNRFFGSLLRLEASSACQLRCPVCSMARRRFNDPVIGNGVLKFEHFKALVDDNPRLRAIELSNWGEIFLNPELLEIMRYAQLKGIKLRAVNGVNLNHVKDDVLRGLVEHRFGQITVSIDGASHDTYKLYRRRGSFHQVIANIERINHFKRELNSTAPKLIWQFIIFGHNEHEVLEARELAERLGMEFRPKLNHTPSFSPVQNKEKVRRESGLGAANRDEFAKAKKRAYSRPCTQLWTSPQVNWDGKLLGCCANKFGDFGNVFEQGLEGAMQNERYVYAKRMVLGLAPPREGIPCTVCKVYRQYVLGEAPPAGHGHSADPMRPGTREAAEAKRKAKAEAKARAEAKQAKDEAKQAKAEAKRAKDEAKRTQDEAQRAQDEAQRAKTERSAKASESASV
jgi:MoaA/NifB/PqqE/SkfB family radical SAM enzyme